MAITEEEYASVMVMLATVARTVDALPLAEVRDTLAMTESIGPILYPTQYRESIDNVRDQRELVDAFVEVQRVARNIRERSTAKAST